MTLLYQSGSTAHPGAAVLQTGRSKIATQYPMIERGPPRQKQDTAEWNVNKQKNKEDL